jgi:hypothetical protein
MLSSLFGAVRVSAIEAMEEERDPRRCMAVWESGRREVSPGISNTDCGAVDGRRVVLSTSCPLRGLGRRDI